MNFTALHDAAFGPLDHAVSDWDQVVRNLEKLERDADTGLRGQANKANWAGLNATVSRQFIGKTAGEFADARTQATSIRNILSDTRTELKTCQSKLKEVVERCRAKNIVVAPTVFGGFTVTKSPGDGDGTGGGTGGGGAGGGARTPAGTPDETIAFRDEIQALLNKAADIDDSAARVLKALAAQSDLGFSDAEYADRDAGTEALETADRLAEIAKNPRNLTPDQFADLNAGLKRYAHDELFAERFATAVGPRGVAEFWAGLGTDHRSGDVRRAHGDDYDELQQYLSFTLATASQSDTPAMTRWKSDMIDLGDRQIGGGINAPLGFQVMSNLMRFGNYDDGFLTEYGNALMAEERQQGDNGRRTAFERAHVTPVLNYTGPDSGVDPLIGYLKGLSGSPAAATDFFGESFVRTSDDHDFKEEEGEKKAELSNFDYLFEERRWPMDHSGKDSPAGRDFLAQALEAATTGHPAGEMPTVDTPPHTEEQAALLEKLVQSISNDPKRLTDHMQMADSFGQIASEYLPDISRAASNDSFGNTDKLFPIAGQAAELSHVDVTRFLVTVGQSPEANAAVQVGQANYMGSLMAYHLDPNLPEELRYPHPPEDIVEAISRRSAEVDGVLAIGQQEAILGPAGKEVQDFQNSVAQQKNAWSGAIGLGVGVGVSFIATPLGGALAGGTAGTVSSLVLEHIFQQAETNSLQDAAKHSAGIWEYSQDESLARSQLAAEKAAEMHRTDYQHQVADWVDKGTKNGFNDADSNTGRMAKDLTTEVS
ncbi:hypothetical protein ABZ714_27850 [Streptomyces sp. NPDC006798]|uniref:hypothetical protein n=1 Tax=Streptomyces sp. NPDC006798 TaxID=3155462 RepID=UPI00340F40CF